MTIDLRKDAADVRKMLVEALARYAAKSAHPKACAHYKPVGAVGLTYDCGSGARVTLHLDTRRAYEPDGTWTHDSFAELERPEWETAYGALQDRDLTFALADGSRLTLQAGTDDETYVNLFGEMLVSLLKGARASGVFAALPRQSRCELGVEEVEGMFGWPAYRDRGKDNLL